MGLNDGLGSTLLALRLLPCSLSLHFCCLVSFQSESIWQPTPCLVWLGTDFSNRNISIPPERISSAEHVSTLSMLNTHFLLLENWPVLWGIFPWVYVWEQHPHHDQIFSFLKFYLALLGIAKFPYRRLPWGSYVSGRKLSLSLTVDVSSPHIVIIPLYAIPLWVLRVVLVQNTILRKKWNVEEARRNSS